MPQSHSLVLFSLIETILVCAGVLSYMFIYPKKKINLLLILLLASCLPLFSLLRPGLYESGDMSLHAIEAISFYTSLSQGIINPIWAGQLNATFGYPAFMFIYPLPYYLISLFHLLGFSFISATKLFLAFSFVASGLTMYFWIKDEVNKLAGVISGIFYLFAPYHLINMHFRVDIGEMLSFVLIPLILFLIKRTIERKKTKYFVFLSFSFASSILSHPAMSLASIPLVIFYSLFCSIRIKEYAGSMFRALLSIFIGILLTSYYWLPTILNLKYTHQPFYSNKVSFPEFTQLLYSPWRLGFLFQGPTGELSFLIGYAHLVIIIFSLIALFRKKIVAQKPLLIFSLVFFFIYFLMMLEISSLLWSVIPLIKNFQFSWRLLLFTSLFGSAITGIVLYKFNKKIILIVCILAITVTILNWGNRRVIPDINDKYLIKVLPLATSGGEGLPQAAPVWTDPKNPWQSAVPRNHLEVISGKAEIKNLLRSEVYHSYVVKVNDPAYLKENTLFFPGWKLYIDGINEQIIYSNTKYPGIATFRVSNGMHKVELKFEETWERTLANQISVFGLLVLAGYAFYFSSKPHSFK